MTKPHLTETPGPPQPASDASPLRAFLDPTGIAIVGASSNPHKLGFGLVRNLIACGYRGGIYPVNPRGGEILGLKTYADLSVVPDPVDLAVILIPAPAVADVLETCGRRGIHSAIIGSGGFREIGAEGRELEKKCLDAARSAGIRIIGPNCIGVINTHVPLDTTFLSPRELAKGNVAFVSQSGAICAAVVDWASSQGFGLSALVSLGNQVDVSESEALEMVAADPDTKVITVYLEGVSDGATFVRKMAAVARTKPIIALKVGRSEAGGRAIASHTGALAGQDAIYEAAFRRAGVMRAETTEELFAWARAFANAPLPRGRRVAVLTNAGGPGVAAVDAVDSSGLELAEFSDVTRAKLQAILPPAANTKNPVDMLATAGPTEYAKCLQFLLEADEVDGVVVIMPPPPMYEAEDVAYEIIPVIKRGGKPVFVVPMGEERVRTAVRLFRLAGVPDYRFPERAIASMAVLARRHDVLDADAPLPAACSDDFAAAIALIGVDGVPDGFLGLTQAASVAAACGIPVEAPRPVRSMDEAVALASEIGMPVALKISSVHAVHKSDAGGLILNLTTSADVSRAFDTISERVAQLDDEHAEVCIQKMLGGGLEVVVGAVRDPQFGPVVMFGTGGTSVESVKDVAFGIAPLTVDDIDEMLRSTFAGRHILGPRSMYRDVREQLGEVLCRLGRAMIAIPVVAEIEVNPLFVRGDEPRLVAVDARVRVNRGG